MIYSYFCTFTFFEYAVLSFLHVQNAFLIHTGDLLHDHSQLLGIEPHPDSPVACQTDAEQITQDFASLKLFIGSSPLSALDILKQMNIKSHRITALVCNSTWLEICSMQKKGAELPI